MFTKFSARVHNLQVRAAPIYSDVAKHIRLTCCVVRERHDGTHFNGICASVSLTWIINYLKYTQMAMHHTGGVRNRIYKRGHSAHTFKAYFTTPGATTAFSPASCTAASEFPSSFVQ